MKTDLLGPDRMSEVTNAEARFEFGKNWRSYASQVSEHQVQEAVSGLRNVLQVDSLQGKAFLDIGCGSGIHTLAALQMGAARVVAIDIDADSVATTEELLARYAPSDCVDVRQGSILDDSVLSQADFDVVYSWGVLHHTGRMHAAIEQAASLVREDGLFAFALYRRTWCCPIWSAEKRWYVGAGERARGRARAAYAALVRLGLLIAGRSFADYVARYPVNSRGMDFWHDVHDWLGGYPYESISPSDVDVLMRRLGFEKVWCSTRRDLFSRSGILGSGCDEFLYRRSAASLRND